MSELANPNYMSPLAFITLEHNMVSTLAFLTVHCKGYHSVVRILALPV